MNASDHLNNNQILRFAAKTLSADESRNVGGHLLRCIDCRNLLPLPNVKQFLAAVTDDRDPEEGSISSSVFSLERSFTQSLIGLFAKPRNLAWVLGVLTVIFSLAALSALKIPNERRVDAEVAQSFETLGQVSDVTNDEPENPKRAIPEVVKKPSSTTGTRQPELLSKRQSQLRNTRATPNVPQVNVSSIRGNTEVCAEGRTVQMELGSQKTELVLKWKPVPKAAKYHLYISDDNEVLVDEFETDQDTSYVIKERLDPAKSYKWKIVVTLLSGQKLYVDAEKFTAKDFQSSLNGHKSKASSNTRCLAN